MTSTPVYTIIRGRAPANRHEAGRIMDVTYHDIIIAPKSPLRLGQTVQVYNLELHPDHPTLRCQEPKQYMASRTDIKGEIVGIRAVEKDLVELIVKNALMRSATMYAYLTIPYQEGTTITLGKWMWAAVWLARRLLRETRRVPLEKGAIVLRRVYHRNDANQNEGEGSVWEIIDA
ncbi:hypothetical protein C8Q73DRAFT_667175 [Cubamyces lactineus]|nr:hypothetical protein C8Q73DRAFT_667175 [Cubamyces lactineus]